METKIGLVNYQGQEETKKVKGYKKETSELEKPKAKPEVFLSDQDPFYRGNPTNDQGDEIISTKDKYQTQEEKLNKRLREVPKKVN